MRSSSILVAVASAISPAFAQTFTSCNPINATCSASPGLAQGSYSIDFTSADAPNQFKQSWTTAAGTKVTYGSQGMVFNISNAALAPTITSNFTFLFGRVDVKMQAAPGQGIVSSIVLESADLDEVDWEVLGGNSTSVETNYYGKGANNVATYAALDSPQTQFYTYSIDWTSSSLVWSVNGKTVRTLAYSDANGGESFPQTPMALKLGNWDGGKPGGQPGTIAWAGGLTDFSKGPFVMYIESVTVTNYNPANYYNWTDHTGSFSSIKPYNTTSDVSGSNDASTAGTSTVASVIGGPTLVSGTGSASAAANTGATTGSGSTSGSSSDSGSNKKNSAGKTAQTSFILSFSAIAAVAVLAWGM